MSLAWTLKLLISLLLLPPGNGLALLCVAGVFRRRRWAFGLAVFGAALLAAQCVAPVADRLIGSLESQNAPLAKGQPDAGAIVILGSGLATDAAEYGGDTASDRTLIRTRYGAVLARQYGLPVLVTGGRPLKARRPKPRSWPASCRTNWAWLCAGRKQPRWIRPRMPPSRPPY
jgi:uncharacterized SAM-binding protein YcdF (DUF218 family)